MDRRRFIGATAAAAACAALPGFARASDILTRKIPSSGEIVPALGMGSWLTFDIGDDAGGRRIRRDVLDAFFNAGGRLIDSSPMYGTSQEVIGWCLDALGKQDGLFAADKVWTPQGQNGPAQIERSRTRWRIPQFDLLQVHNLVDWERHLDTLFAMKAEGRLRYVGVTTYAGLRHDAVERIMRSHPLDFIQATCNIADREAEARLLPLAEERGIAFIANRPFREGQLFSLVRGKPLPGVAAEIGARNWAQFMLKYVISHPALTCAIPATRRVDHMRENMAALSGPVPDARLRREMSAAFDAI
ncbi:MAG TPA: aldo/keto reductase [Parvularculaceae bacterium]|nr:aldo/keto reductase [Parvularculaceae bacterium]